jgi:hypothetical protein
MKLDQTKGSGGKALWDSDISARERERARTDARIAPQHTTEKNG